MNARPSYCAYKFVEVVQACLYKLVQACLYELVLELTSTRARTDRIFVSDLTP